MDYTAEINTILKDLQELSIPATYGNVKKMLSVMERLAAMADALKASESKEAAFDA